MSLVRCFTGLGCEVALVLPSSKRVDWLPQHNCFNTDAASFAGGEVKAFNSQPFVAAVADACHRYHPDIAIAVYAWLAPCLAATPESCVRVVDTHEVLHDRTTSFTTCGLNPWIVCDHEMERSLLLHADIIIANHDADADTFRTLLDGSRQVICVPHSFDMKPVPSPALSKGFNVMFIGSWHDGNLGIYEFLKQGWPRVRAVIPQCQLTIYGHIGKRLKCQKGLRIGGVVSDLEPAYRDAALAICPISVGSGFKVKTVEALSCGRTIVGTKWAISGLPSPSIEIWRIANDWSKFADCIISLLLQPDRRRTMETAGLDYAKQYFSDSAVQHVIQNKLLQHNKNQR